MIDRVKVIQGLECCADFQRKAMHRNCEKCPYNDDPENGTCKTLYPLMRDAVTLLEVDRMQLLIQRTRLEDIANIALHGIPENRRADNETD